LPNPFERELGIPLPKCCSLGSCCKGASPSTPYHQLLKRAAAGDEFARGFFSIMIPYQSHAEAEKVVPGVVERTLKAAEKLPDFKGPQDIVFYHCRYQTEDNKCGVWEDRPQFCRDYPDTPFVVMAPGCAFEPWAKACKEKYFALKEEVAQLKNLKAELAELKAIQRAGMPLPPAEAYCSADTKIDAPILESHNADTLSLVLSLTGLYLASPLQSIHFMR
jgi:Fe-S-cluster containining protein